MLKEIANVKTIKAKLISYEIVCEIPRILPIIAYFLFEHQPLKNRG